jgi:hypothetical protein
MKPKNQFGLPQLLTLLFQSRLDFFAEGKIWHLRDINSVNKWNLTLKELILLNLLTIGAAKK